MDDLPPELGADDGRKHLHQNPDPAPLVHNVQLLQALAHGATQHMVCLNEPAPAGAVLLAACCALGIAAGEEDDLVLGSAEQLLLTRQAGEHVGQEGVEVGLVGIGQGGGVEDVDGQAGVGGDGRAVEDAGGGLGQLVVVVGGGAGRRNGVEGGAAQTACALGELGAHCLAGPGQPASYAHLRRAVVVGVVVVLRLHAPLFFACLGEAGREGVGEGAAGRGYIGKLARLTAAAAGGGR